MPAGRIVTGISGTMLYRSLVVREREREIELERERERFANDMLL